MPLYAVILTGSATPVVVRHSAFKDVDTALNRLGPFTSNECLFVAVEKQAVIMDPYFTFTHPREGYNIEVKYSVNSVNIITLQSIMFSHVEMIDHTMSEIKDEIYRAAQRDYSTRTAPTFHSP